MISPLLREATQIEAATASLISTRPAYKSILGFYGPVFVAQANAAPTTCPQEIEVDTSLLEMKSEEGFAIIEPSAFTIDVPAAESLLTQICNIATASGEKLAGAGKALFRSMEEGLVLSDVFSAVLNNSTRIDALAEKLKVPTDMLSLLLYLAVRPSIEAGSRKLSELLAGDLKNFSNCPICGNSPIIGELDSEGGQWVHCSLCWHRWPVARMGCSFCGNSDSESLRYVYSDDEPEYRVNLCGECKRYLKVVDTRKMDRGFYPPLEQVASLHLDMIAAEKGYDHLMEGRQVVSE